LGKLLLTTLLLFGFTAQAAEENLLKNPDFESRLSRWVKTGSSTLTIESANPLEGSYSAIWDASATGEFARSNLYVIPDGMQGNRCSIEFKYLWESGVAGDILLNVDDGTNNLLSESLSPTSGSARSAAYVLNLRLTPLQLPTIKTFLDLAEIIYMESHRMFLAP